MDSAIVDRLAEAEVLVVGDVLLDRFIEGKVTRISREAPVPVLSFGSVRAMMGGACNVAANILATGGRVSLVGVRGGDPAAEELISLFQGFSRLSAQLVDDPSRRTTVKTRYLHGWQQLLCIDSGDLEPVSPEVREKLVAAAIAAMPGANVVVVSDYGRGALDDEAIRALIGAARAAGRPVLVDPRRTDISVFAGAALITPNLEEMRAFTGILATSDDLAEQGSRLVLDRSSIDAVLLTRGSGGMTLLERGHPPIHIRAETHRVFDVTGAGDTVVATIASALAVGTPLVEAVQLANTAAGIAVSKPGTATVQPQELREALGRPRYGGVASWPDAAENVELWKSLGLRVGFTNGVFDLVHRGHLHSLEQARARVDRLVVGLNTDRSVKRLKGPDRPVQDEHARSAVVAAIRYVDLVVLFDQDTPSELVAALKPDVLFKGADYAGVEIPGAAFVKAHGGVVELLPLLEGHSTTRTVDKVRGRA